MKGETTDSDIIKTKSIITTIAPASTVGASFIGLITFKVERSKLIFLLWKNAGIIADKSVDEQLLVRQTPVFFFEILF